MKFDLKTAIGSIAPTLATMLGGPLAGTAVAALTNAFGLSPSASKDEITSVAQSGLTPEIIAKVRAEDQRHAEVMQQQGIDLAKLNAAHQEALAATDASDRNSARQREMSIKDVTPALLATGITTGFFGILAYLMVYSPPAESRDVLNIMLGSLGTAWVSVVAYYFGSSAGSQKKTELLAQSQPIR
jgi:hypothetical protein